jgi:hypothetical protein
MSRGRADDAKQISVFCASLLAGRLARRSVLREERVGRLHAYALTGMATPHGNLPRVALS